ncbi:MAG: rhamnogalacturonan lyase, partial [Verrucomicrobiota bacterium]
MLLQSHALIALALAMAVVAPNNLHAERQMEKLGRGVVALVKTDGTIYVGWRLLGTDPENIGFNLYRTANSGTPIQLTTNQTVTTDFVDTTANLSQTNRYFVRPVIGGVLGAASGSFTVPANVPVHDSYLSIPLTFDPGDQVIQDQGQNMYVEVGDFDGDGEYEYLLKWANNPYTDVGDPVACTDTYKLDAYKLDGTRLWRVNLGWNLMCGPEFSPTVVCDLDGDGIAEIITKTAEGTTDGTGITIGDTDGDDITDYRPTSGSPVITNGPEFLSVFSGATGKELARVPWIARGNLADWGDATGNRGNRNNMTVAWLDGHGPSIVMCRGIYARMKMEAWNFRNGQLTNLWKWDSATDPLYQQWQTEQGVTEGKGSHMIRSGDVDGDGRDEVLRGSLTMGPDGVPLYTKPTGHGDEMRFGDLDPDRPGLEVWMGYENPPNPINGMQLYDAATGDPVWGIITGTSVGGDAGKSLAAPFNLNARGFQFWGWDGTYDRDGKLLTTAQPGTRHEVW